MMSSSQIRAEGDFLLVPHRKEDTDKGGPGLCVLTLIGASLSVAFGKPVQWK